MNLNPVYPVEYNDFLDKVNLRILWNQGYRGLLLKSVGFNNVDLPGAEKLGFVWDKLEDPYSIDVAENTLVLLSGLWKKLGFRERLKEKHALVIGSKGNVGSKVCNLLKGIGMKVLPFDTIMKNHDRQKLSKLVSKAKFIFLCVPLNKKNTNYFSKKLFQKMAKQKPYIINVSGRIMLLPIYVLEEQLKLKNIGGYACDETTRHSIFDDESCYFQPHSGGRTLEGWVAKTKELDFKEQVLLAELQKPKKADKK